MSNSQVVTIRMPDDLKKRLEAEAKRQGVSINQLTNYMLNTQITELETISKLEHRLSKKSVASLKPRVNAILDKVPRRPVPEWDQVK